MFFKQVYMSFFSSIGNSVMSVVRPIVKDAIPIAAAVATGGASLAYIKPTNSLAKLDKMTGLPLTQIASMGSPGGLSSGGQQTEAPQSIVATETIAPPFAPAQSTSIYDQLTPYLNSFMQASQNKSSDVSPNATMLASAPIAQQAPSSKMPLIIGGIVVLVGGFLLTRKK